MKKFAVAPIVLLVLLMVFSGCNKDKEPPNITLNGDAEMIIPLDGTYQEPGATAFDEVDGDLSNEILIESTVDETKIGNYTVTYTVLDERGNAASAVRNVTVAIQQENWVGNYNTGTTCGGSWFIDNAQSVAAGAAENEISFNGFYQSGGRLDGIISGQNITFASQGVLLTTVSGTGTINDNASVIILNLNLDNGFNNESCTVTYTRQ